MQGGSGIQEEDIDAWSGAVDLLSALTALVEQVQQISLATKLPLHCALQSHEVSSHRCFDSAPSPHLAQLSCCRGIVEPLEADTQQGKNPQSCADFNLALNPHLQTHSKGI